MNATADIKRFILRALNRLDGIPAPEDSLNSAINEGVVPKPLPSEISQAKQELQEQEYILGRRDELDESLSWTLTVKGQHKAAQLG